MARPRTELDDARILALAKTGIGGREIAAKLRSEGADISDRTVCRRLAEIAPKVRAVQAAKLAVAVVATPAEPPTAHVVEAVAPSSSPTEAELAGASAEALHALRARAAAALEVAVVAGNFGAIGSMGRLLVAIEEHRRKIAPPPAVDMNEAPDIRAAAERAKRIDFETLENIIAHHAGGT